jgi:ADP-ribose pyrophosphatase YjhB (NUDIX family)
MTTNQELAELATELRTIAAYGLNFARNEFDEERFQAVLAISARMEALALGEDAQELMEAFNVNGFALSAMPSVEAVVLNEGKILLVRRKDDGLWCLPGGITDPGETLAESVCRELHEETGILGQVKQLLGIYDSRLWHSEKKIHFYHFLFLVEAADLTPRPGDDAVDAGYFAEDNLPPMSPGHHVRAPFVFKQLRGEEPLPYFDKPADD